MNLVILSGSIERRAFASWLPTCSPKEDLFEYLITSDWREIRFVRYVEHQADWLDQSDRGRAFGKTTELRWRLNEDESKVLCRWISHNGTEPPEAEMWQSLPACELKRLRPQRRSYLLWGEPLFQDGQWLGQEQGKPIWYQARIPRKLEYPIPDDLASQWDKSNKTPLVLRVCAYRQGGETMFERFVGFGKYPDKEERS